jgi:CBS domain-containing protein
MFSVCDIIDIFRISYRSASRGASVKLTFDTLTVGAWLRMRTSLAAKLSLFSEPLGAPSKMLAADPEDHLFHVARQMHARRAHYMPVLDVEQNCVVGSLTRRALLSAMLLRFTDAERLFCQPLCVLGVGTYDENIMAIPEYTAVISVLALLIEHRVFGLPVVNAAGQVVDVYLAEEAAFLANDPTFACLDASVADLRNARLQLVRRRPAVTPPPPLPTYLLFTANAHHPPRPPPSPGSWDPRPPSSPAAATTRCTTPCACSPPREKTRTASCAWMGRAAAQAW